MSDRGTFLTADNKDNTAAVSVKDLRKCFGPLEVLKGVCLEAQEGDVISILVRRRWLILLPFALGLAVAPWVAARLPKVYRSETLIMVVPQRVPDSYVKATINESI